MRSILFLYYNIRLDEEYEIFTIAVPLESCLTLFAISKFNSFHFEMKF